MPRTPEITIPTDRLPQDGRFGSGPSKIPVTVVEDLAGTGSSFLGTSHRKPTVRATVGNIRAKLADLYELPDGYEVVLGVGGATAFWDAAAFGLIENRSAHFVCGVFSEKFANVAAAAPHLDDPVVVKCEFGDAPPPEIVAGVDTVAYVHNETSTGVLAPFGRLGDALVAVDGTSAAGAVPIDVNAVDAYYFSPQKAFASEGGLWVSLMSPAAIGRIHDIEESGRWIPTFLSLGKAVANSRKDQTLNTPSLSTLYFLDRQLDTLLDGGGITAAYERVTRSSAHLYAWAEASSYAESFVRDIDRRSPTVVTIDLDPAVPVGDLAAVLRRHGIVDVEGYRALGRNQIRIATFPAVELDDVERLTWCIDYVVDRL